MKAQYSHEFIKATIHEPHPWHAKVKKAFSSWNASLEQSPTLSTSNYVIPFSLLFEKNKMIYEAY